ncbi:TonB family protein, partial [Achromobacter xylosoxidans]
MRWRVLACSLALTLACAAPPVFAAAPANQAEWTQAVQRRMISSFKFPPEARRLSGPISLSLKIIVRRDGSIADVSVDRSSGDAAVDRAATRMVQRAGPLPAFSADMTGEKTALSLPLRFQQEEDEPAGDRADDRGPPADIAPRRYADAASGLTVTVPSPLRVGRAP